jgi:hypothetical protein
MGNTGALLTMARKTRQTENKAEQKTLVTWLQIYQVKRVAGSPATVGRYVRKKKRDKGCSGINQSTDTDFYMWLSGLPRRYRSSQ